MSRLPVAELIEQGDYLNSDFEPSSLTVAQLLGILGYHNIRYPTPYTKSKVVQLFNDEIKANATKYKKQRIQKEPSDDGIIDGATGRPLNGNSKPRRTSRRLSRAPSEAEQDLKLINKPDPPKRRRSSAQPSLGGARTVKAESSQPMLIEESEPEEELLVRKVGRSKKAEAAGTEIRRVSGANEDSGWEDNNIFQSGAESSSPIRPPAPRATASRKSSVPAARKSRKATSAPPQSSPPSSPLRQPQFPEFPSRAQFAPVLSPQSPPHVPRVSSPLGPMPDFGQLIEEEDEADELNIQDGDMGVNESFGANDDLMEEEGRYQAAVEAEAEDFETEDHKHVLEVSRRLAESTVIKRRSTDSRSTPIWLRLLYLILAVSSSAGIYSYKSESSSIGFCDTNRSTNDALEAMKTKWAEVDACNLEDRPLLHATSSEHQDQTPCPPLTLIPIPHPQVCTPCPEHSTCTQHTVLCEQGYILQTHPLLRFLPPRAASASLIPYSTHMTPADAVYKLVSDVFDGMPGLGPVAFAPQCVEDPKRKEHLGKLGNAIERILAQERGKRLCEGSHSDFVKDAEGGEARRWGMDVGELQNLLKAKAKQGKLMSDFDNLYHEAIARLVEWGGVFISEDNHGTRYIAHKTPDLTWACAVTVKGRDTWVEWRNSVYGLVFTIIGFYLAKARRTSRHLESKRVAELANVAMDTLRNQELSHHTDPVTTPQPYLSSLQLRDLILRDEHSVNARRRLWDQVERIVEANANVRANLEEVPGGDELRVWRWVGSSGGRLQWEPETPGSSATVAA